MKAQGLRINNYFKYGSKTFKVLGIGNDYILANSNRGNVEFGIEDIEPVPLTEEWLLKIGFIVTETNAGIECFYFGKRYSVLQPSNTNVWLLVDGEKGLCDIKHVHQLQNLYFALTGEELQIK